MVYTLKNNKKTRIPNAEGGDYIINRINTLGDTLAKHEANLNNQTEIKSWTAFKTKYKKEQENAQTNGDEFGWPIKDIIYKELLNMK